MVTIDIQDGTSVEICLFEAGQQKGKARKVEWKPDFDEGLRQLLMTAINDLIKSTGDTLIQIGIALEIELSKHRLRYDPDQRCICAA